MKPRYTKEQTADLIRLRLSGVPIEELARLYGRTPRAIEQKLIRSHALLHERWTPEEDAILKAAMQEVARKTGRSLGAVRTRARKIT